MLRDDYFSEDEDAQTGREASSSQVHSDDGVTHEEHEETYSGERGGEEGIRSTPPASCLDDGDSNLHEKNAFPASGDPPLCPNSLLPPMSGGNNDVSRGEGHKSPDPKLLTCKNKDIMKADDETDNNAEEEESSHSRAAHVVGQQCEINMTVGKRRTRRGWQYNVV